MYLREYLLPGIVNQGCLQFCKNIRNYKENKQINKVKTKALDNLHPNMLSNLCRMSQSHILQLQHQRGCYHRNPDILLADQIRFCRFLKCSHSVLAFDAGVNIFLLCVVIFPSATVWDPKFCTVSQDASISDVNYSTSLLKCLRNVNACTTKNN